MYKKTANLTLLVALGGIRGGVIIKHQYRETRLLCKSNSFPPVDWYFMAIGYQNNISPFYVTILSMIGEDLYNLTDCNEIGVPVDFNILEELLHRPDADEIKVEYIFPSLSEEEVIE